MTSDKLPPCPVPGCGEEMRRTSSGIIWHGSHNPRHWIEFESEEQFTRLCDLVEAGRRQKAADDEPGMEAVQLEVAKREAKIELLRELLDEGMCMGECVRQLHDKLDALEHETDYE